MSQEGPTIPENWFPRRDCNHQLQLLCSENSGGSCESRYFSRHCWNCLVWSRQSWFLRLFWKDTYPTSEVTWQTGAPGEKAHDLPRSVWLLDMTIFLVAFPQGALRCLRCQSRECVWVRILETAVKNRRCCLFRQRSICVLRICMPGDPRDILHSAASAVAPENSPWIFLPVHVSPWCAG